MDEQPIINEQNTMNETLTPNKSFPVKTLILIIILSIVAFSLLAIALSQKNNNKQITETNQPLPTPDVAQTTLTISPNLIKLATSSAYNADIIINTGQNSVNKVQLEILYDPKALIKVDINSGTFFTDPKVFLKNIDSANGRISFALGVRPGEKGILGQGVLTSISFATTPKSASASVTLLPKTQVTADGQSQSVLKTTVNAEFNFVNLTPTPTVIRKK
jgi:hypothetical protein